MFKNLRFICLTCLSFLVISFTTKSFSQVLPIVEKNLVTDFEKNWKKQSRAIPYLQTSKGIYETGEDLWFKFYLLEDFNYNYFQGDSTLFLQMVNTTTNEITWQEKYPIINGMCSGKIYINEKLNEGDYKIIAYSKSTKNSLPERNALKVVRVVERISPYVVISPQIRYISSEQIRVDVAIIEKKSENNSTQRTLSAEIDNGIKSLAKDEKKILQSNVEFVFPIQEPLQQKRITLKLKGEHGEQIAFNELMIPVKDKSLTFNSFPESGNLVAGLSSVLAFQLTDSSGSAVEASGYLTLDDKPFLDFHTNNNGLGKLKFKPLKGRKYKANIKLFDRVHSYDLPEIKASGVNLEFKSQDSSLAVFNLKKSKEIANGTFYLRAQSKGRVLAVASLHLVDSAIIRIPINEIQMGIMEFTVFDSNCNPLAERLLFTGLEKRLNIKTEFKKLVFGRKEKVEFKIKVSDEKGNPLVTDLSMSIYDSIYNSKQNASSILSHYLLSTQLKGRINEPSSYFDNFGRPHIERLDLLMLTHGWRNYIFSDTSNITKINPDLKNFLTVDMSLEQNKKQKVKDIFIMLSTSENQDFQKIQTYDGQSGVKITNNDLISANGGYIYIKPILPEGWTAKYSMPNYFSTPVKSLLQPIPNTAFQITNIDSLETRQSIKDIIRLSDVTIKGKSNSARYFSDKYMGSLDSITRMRTQMDYVTHGVILNCPLCIGTDFKKEIPIDGKMYKKVDAFNNKNPRSHGFDWRDISDIRYKKVNYSEEELLKMNNMFRIKSYYAHKEFYNLDYSSKESTEKNAIDTRNTLFWSPSIITDKNGEAKGTFYTSDIISSFNINFEGTNGNGLIGYFHSAISVQ